MKNEKQAKMKKSTKYLLIGTLVLFLSILGASMAYYLARISGNLSGRAAGTELELTITPLTSEEDDLIPLDSDVETLQLAALGYQDKGACIDINGYSVCQIYRIRVSNKGSVPLTVNGTVNLYGANTPNINCAKMDDEDSITNNNSCMGENILASNEVLPANNHNDYYVMVYIKNLDEPQTDSGEFNGTVTFTSIDGKKVKGRFKHEDNLVEHITKLYSDNKDSIVQNNSIEYQYATSVNLMNDRLGGTTTSLDGGNIRYYGENPNNYIDIGDKTEVPVEQGNWEKIAPGAFSSEEQCLSSASQYGMTDTMIEQQYGSYGLTTVAQFCAVEEEPAGQPILWRIIGVFDGNIKILRNESIGEYSWDTSASSINNGKGINEWSQADLMKLLNPGYGNEQIGGSLWWNSESGTCYNGENDALTECDFTSSGLSNDAKDLIVDNLWYLGGINSSTEIESFASKYYF